jgi:hypothetical protein
MPWRRIGEWMYRPNIFLTSALVGVEWSASRTGHFTPGERDPGAHWIGGWVDPRASVDDMEERKFLILLGLELWPLGRPARSQLLYWLRYPSFYETCCSHWNKTIQIIFPLNKISVDHELFSQTQPGSSVYNLVFAANFFTISVSYINIKEVLKALMSCILEL